MRRPSPFLTVFIFLTLFIVFSVFLIANFLKPYLPFKNYLLGLDKSTSYLVLLGNDTEMRANGGFVGSYAKIILSYPSIDLTFQDIYVPNGQLQGFVAPPAPIQEAFQHGTWQLANADWEPDFPTTANTIRWFMEKGKEENPDNLVLVNLTTIKKILDVVGPFTVSEYSAQITPDNLYLFLQGKTEVDFFPGSTQKKDVLTAVGTSLKKEILHLPLTKKLQIAQIVYQDLVDQNILINSKNIDFQNLLIAKNFAGKLISTTPDTYLLVETNLGANKANAYVQRETTHNLTFQNNQTTHQVVLRLSNSSTEANPNPPFHYGGDYIAYLRFYLPPNAQNISVASSSASVIAKEQGDCGNLPSCHSGLDPESIKITPQITKKYNLTEIGFWNTTPAQGETTLTLTYTLPPISKDNYSLTLLKQHGLVSSPQTLNLDTRTFTTGLKNDFLFPKTIP